MIEFEWDSANIEHLAVHSVTPAEFEQAMILDPLDLNHEIVDGEDRYTFVGPTQVGRIIVAVYTMREQRVRAVTAFTAGLQVRKEWANR